MTNSSLSSTAVPAYPHAERGGGNGQIGVTDSAAIEARRTVVVTGASSGIGRAFHSISCKTAFGSLQASGKKRMPSR
jgi:hypothetical protein